MMTGVFHFMSASLVSFNIPSLRGGWNPVNAKPSPRRSLPGELGNHAVPGNRG